MTTKPVFSDVEFMTAAEKGKVARQWERFLKHLSVNGCSVEKDINLFPKSLYEHLHLHCGYIAYYNRYSFFDIVFVRPKDCVDFVERWLDMDSMVPWSNGPTLSDMMPDYRDLGGHMVSVARKYGPGIIAKAASAERRNDLTLACSLLVKHGVNATEACGG